MFIVWVLFWSDLYFVQMNPLTYQTRFRNLWFDYLELINYFLSLRVLLRRFHNFCFCLWIIYQGNDWLFWNQIWSRILLEGFYQLFRHESWPWHRLIRKHCWVSFLPDGTREWLFKMIYPISTNNSIVKQNYMMKLTLRLFDDIEAVILIIIIITIAHEFFILLDEHLLKFHQTNQLMFAMKLINTSETA